MVIKKKKTKIFVVGSIAGDKKTFLWLGILVITRKY